MDVPRVMHAELGVTVSVFGEAILTLCSGPHSGRNSYSYCYACPAGKYSGAWSSSCASCPKAKYQPHAGKNFCYGYRICRKHSGFLWSVAVLDVPRGDINRALELDLVERKQYSVDTGLWYFRCPAGKYQPYGTQTYCYNCPRGKYSSAGKSSCSR